MPNPLRICVIGSGPAGMYTSSYLSLHLKRDYLIHIYEKLALPFGLIRYGVAPDHISIKNIANKFNKILMNDKIKLLTNHCIHDLSQLSSYDAIVLAYGANLNKQLNIMNESLAIDARDFVGWYNSHPNCTSTPDLNTESSVILGMGNVALDISRILLCNPDSLINTDINRNALSALVQGKIKHVHICGRRGPKNIAFTTREFRDLMKLDIDFHTDSTLIKQQLDDPNIDRPKSRLLELIYKNSLKDKIHEKSLHLHFHLNPLQVIQEAGSPTGIRFQNDQVIKSKLIIKSIGYAIDAIKGVEITGDRIANDCGRVSPGVYVSGWLKRGPTGVVATTMNDSFETAQTLIDDLDIYLYCALIF